MEETVGSRREDTSTPPAGLSRRHIPRNAVAVALVAVLAALPLGCGDDGNAEPAGETPSPDPQDPTTTTLSPEAEVEAAYLAHWAMLDRLSEAPDPDDPEIAERTTGDALGDVVTGLTALASRGHVASIGPAYAHSVLSIDVEQSRAVVRDCVVDDSIILDQATGERVRGGDLVTELLEVTLLREQEGWKVSNVETISTETGAASCDD